MRSLEHSLQRLGTNAIDIVLIHDVNRRWQGDLVEQRGTPRRWRARIARSSTCARRRHQGVRRRRQRLEHPAALRRRWRLRLLHAGGTLHAARSHRARHVHARLRAPRNLGADGGTLQLGHPRHWRATGRDLLLHRRRRRDHGAHAADRGRLRAARRDARRRRAAVPAGASGCRQRGHGNAHRRRSGCEHRALPRANPGRLLGRAQAPAADRRPTRRSPPVRDAMRAISRAPEVPSHSRRE